MKKAKAAIAVTLALVTAFGLSGCGGVLKAKTDINVMIETPVESLDPQQATDGTSFEVIANFMDGLMQMDADGQVVNALADRVHVTADGLVYTFHIRDDACWYNGDPVTAQDFIFGWQRAVDPAVASEYSYMLSDIGQIVNAADIIDGVKDKSELGAYALDDKTLEVHLNVPVSYFLSLMYFPTFYPVNEAFYDSCGDAFGTSPKTVLSNGAFVLDVYEPDASDFHFSKNEKYYNAASVSLTGINYHVIQDSQQALSGYQSGKLDVTLVNGDQVDAVKDDAEFCSIGSGYLWYVVPNIAIVPELANLNIRMAMTMAINRDDITSNILRDGSLVSYTAVPVQFATGPDGSDFSEDQGRHSDVCAYDPAKALDHWEKGLSELGISGFEIDMLVDSDDAPQKVASALKEQWESTLPGLTVNVISEPKKQRVQDLQDGNFQLGLSRWGPDYADPMTYLCMWTTNNPNNYGMWFNRDYDAIINECTSGSLCTDPERRWEALHDAERIVMEEAVIYPIYVQADAELISSSVTGIEFHPIALNRVYKNAVKE